MGSRTAGLTLRLSELLPQSRAPRDADALLRVMLQEPSVWREGVSPGDHFKFGSDGILDIDYLGHVELKGG